MSASELAASPSVLISENYWQRRFAGDPAVLGKSIRLNGALFTIIGITPLNFTGTSIAVPNFWLPLSLYPLIHPHTTRLRDREDLCCRVFGRLAPGMSMRRGAGRDNPAGLPIASAARAELGTAGKTRAR